MKFTADMFKFVSDKLLDVEDEFVDTYMFESADLDEDVSRLFDRLHEELAALKVEYDEQEEQA